MPKHAETFSGLPCSRHQRAAAQLETAHCLVDLVYTIVLDQGILFCPSLCHSVLVIDPPERPFQAFCFEPRHLSSYSPSARLHSVTTGITSNISLG